MDDAGSQSLFVVLNYGYMDPYISILQLETQVNNHEYSAHLTPVQIKKTPVDQKEYVARFREPQGCPWLFSPPTSSTVDLYMVPDCAPADKPLHGYKFNFRTGKCRPITPPRASNYHGHVVNQRRHIYFMAHPVFECFDPGNYKWKALNPLPVDAIHQPSCSTNCIVATAVWDDTILYNIDGCEIWAYNVLEDKWYPVDVEDDEEKRCYSIVGEAVVLENTIYALTSQSLDSVLALSIEREEINGDLVFRCSLRSEILVPGMEQIEFEDKDACCWTRHLVHLGKDNFCLVQSCNPSGLNRYQPIQVTGIKLRGEKSMTVMNICVYEVEIQGDDQFQVRLCFSLPKCKTTALKERKRFVFNLDPFKGFVSKQEDKTDSREPEVVKPVQEEGSVTLPKGRPLLNVQATSELLQFQNNDSSQTNIIDEQDFEQGGSVIQSSQSRDPADTTPEVQEDVPNKSYASVVAQINVASKASTVSAVTGHSSHGYAKPSFAPKASTLGDGAASERSNTNEEGHSIYVRNLPLDATFRQLEKGLKNFGPINRGGIQVRINNMGKCCAFVEFESATSKQNAIKASPIIIEGCLAVIEEKRRRKGLFPGSLLNILYFIFQVVYRSERRPAVSIFSVKLPNQLVVVSIDCNRRSGR